MIPVRDSSGILLILAEPILEDITNSPTRNKVKGHGQIIDFKYKKQLNLRNQIVTPIFVTE